MKFGILKERKNPPDRRVVFSPGAVVQLKELYPDALVKIESSDIRVFTDEQYKNVGVEISDDISDCDVLFGVKEVPVENLIADKSYVFFSHTIKKQPYNRQLLQAILEKNIDLYDHETIVDANNFRLIGFGRYAGIMGAYNTIRGFGLKDALFHLPKAETFSGKEELINHLQRLVFPPLKIVITGVGKVAGGIKEVLDAMKIKEVPVEQYLIVKYEQPVYTQIDVMDYNKRIDEKVLDNDDFYQNPGDYISNFERFAKVSDIVITGHFHANNSPNILTKEMLQSKDCKIKVVGDVSCDINGPIACTLRPTTIAEPFYGYLPSEHKEVDTFHPTAITIMAVDNLPCELPKDASEGFGAMFMEYVIPAFFNNDKDGVLARAKMTEKGKLTPRFSYLQDYVDGN